MSKGVHYSSGCARHRSVYVCITVKGSRVCEHCNVLAVRKYVRASTLQGLQTLDSFTDMYTYTGMYLAHPLDIVNTF